MERSRLPSIKVCPEWGIAQIVEEKIYVKGEKGEKRRARHPAPNQSERRIKLGAAPAA